MAYSLKTAWLRKRVKGATLEEVSIGTIRLRTLFRNYKNGFIVLTNSALEKPQKIDLQTLQSLDFNMTDLTFNNWLTSLGNGALPTTNYVAEDMTKVKPHVTVVDAFAMGIDITAVHDTYHPDVAVPDQLKTSLHLNSEQEILADRRDLFCVAVNGYMHRKEKLVDGVRIKSGRRTFGHSGYEVVSILSFLQVGIVREIGFDAKTINPSGGVAMHQSVLLELNTNLIGKSVLFSFCGVLFGEHNLIHVVDRDSGIIKVDLYKLDLLKMMQSMDRYIDLSSLNLNLPDPYSQAIAIERLKQDRVIKAMLMLDQTFAIVVNATSLEVSYEAPLDLELYGKYNDSRNFDDLLVDPYGRIMPYRKFREGNIVSYAVGIDHYEFAADKRAKDDEVGFTNSNSWWGDRMKMSPRFMRISEV